jgi:hypothetical protein
MNGWEVRVRPWRKRDGSDSATEFTVKAIHRARGWVQTIEQLSQADVERFDPDQAWQRGRERA